MVTSSSPPRAIAYLGPQGTFSEEALLGEPDLASSTLVAKSTIGDAILAIETGEVDAAFVPFENSIEGSVNVTLDLLVFDVELLICREVVLEVHLDLLGVPGARPESLKRIMSFPVASAQCRRYLEEAFSGLELVPANSTADAARVVALEGRLDTAAVSPPLAATIYGLDVLAHAIEDHPDNQTRFVLVGREHIPPPSGHDRTTIACFQRADHPGSLYEILGRFSARNINLTRIESRPTKRSLGDYCFVIEFEGHVTDEVVGDCLRELHMVVDSLKFLGSYRVPGGEPSPARERVELERRVADQWLEQLRKRVGPGEVR